MKLISVIIPVYNVAPYLRECIDSVLNQTYSNLEIILVDDGSTDGSEIICDEYALKDKRIQVVHKENGGQSSARNLGLSKATGEYLYFLDSDDYTTSDALSCLLNNAEEYNSDLVFFEAESFDENGTLSKQTYKRNREYSHCNGMEMFSVLNDNKDFRVSVPLLFIRKTLLTDNNISFFEGVVYEDMLFAFQLFCTAKNVSHCHKTLYFRRYRSNSTMTSVKTVYNFNSAMTVFKEILSFSVANNLTDKNTVISYISRNGLNVYNIFDELSAGDKSACRKALKEFSEFVQTNKQYVSPELLARTHGKIFWAAEKIKQKLL